MIVRNKYCVALTSLCTSLYCHVPVLLQSNFRPIAGLLRSQISMLDLSRVAMRAAEDASAGNSLPNSPRSDPERETNDAAVTAGVRPSHLTPRGRQRRDGSYAAAPPLGAPTTYTASTFSLLPSPRQQPQQAAPSSSLLLPSLWAQWSDGQSGGGATATELMTSPRSAAVSSLQAMPQSEGLTSPRSAAAPSLQPLQRSRQFRAAADCLVAITEDTSNGGPCPFTTGAAVCPSPRKPSSLKLMLAVANETGSSLQPQAPPAGGATAAEETAPPPPLLTPRSRTLLPRSRALSRKLVEMHGHAPGVGMVMGGRTGASGVGGSQGLLSLIKGWVRGT